MCIRDRVKSNASPVKVQSVSSLNMGWWGEGSSTSGIITANATQNVYLEDELVDKLYVKEGDQVKIGDKLLSYDTTLLELDVESEKLNRQATKLKIKTAEQDLEKLKKITPVPDGAASTGGQGDAVLVKTDAVMTAASEETGQIPETPDTGTQTPETPAPETQAPETQGPGKEEVFDPNEEPSGETEKSPLSKIKAVSKLNYDSKPYKGSGTQDDPYVFFCKEGTTIYASFMNKILGYNEAGTSKKKGGMNQDGKGSYAILEIREGDSVNGGFVKSISVNGTVKVDKAYAPDITWTFGSDGITMSVRDVDDPDNEPEDGRWGVVVG